MSGTWEITDLPSSDEPDCEVRVSHLAAQEVDARVSGKSREAEWLSGSWPLAPFDGTLLPNNRKSEWIRFRDQFNRIVSCKAPVGPRTKLTGMKIFAGDFLLNIIEMQEKLVDKNSVDLYSATVEAMDRYFNQTCDAAKERLKFREMRMKDVEPFDDWVLRLEAQAKYCDFEAKQREEEFLQALLRRSVPDIAGKLYESSDMLGGDLQKIINHGKHLDDIRREAAEVAKQQSGGTPSPSSNLHGEEGFKAVNAIHQFKPKSQRARYDPGGPVKGYSGAPKRYRDWPVKREAWAKMTATNCTKCGRSHGPRECAAFRVKCWNCGVWGHFAEMCKNPKAVEGGSRGRRGPAESVKEESQRINQLITRGEETQQAAGDPRLVNCSIGTECVQFLIDTGATVNTVTVDVWESLKVCCRSVIHDVELYPQEVLKAYAKQGPLEVECSFRAYVGVSGRSQSLLLAKFFVVRGTKLSLLGFDTSQELGLIRLGSPSNTTLDLTGVRSEPVCSVEVDSTEFPKIKLAPVKFKVDESVTPRQIIRYNIPKAFENATNERLQAMEKQGIIERADKENDVITHVSPLVLVPKGTNDFRIVVDYRAVNKAIVREPYPMPSLEKIWAEIPNGTLFFTKLDLRDAYFHVVLDESVRHFTTFMTANGLMRFTRLPFGLANAPELFQRSMERLMVKCRNVIIYLDDILVYGTTLEELRENVTVVKKTLEDNNLTINEEKSVYDQRSVDFLGFTIDGSGILPACKIISDIKQFQRPKNSAEVRSFLGMMTFISPFIPCFAHKTKPLRELLAAETKFEWNDERQAAFESLKVAAEEDLVKRGFFNEDDDTVLYSDASPWGIAGVLVQEAKTGGERRIIACASKSLTVAECRYPQLHREALAIIWAMERFAYYLLGRQFTLRCDSEALMFMTKGKSKDVGKRILSRAEGWLLRMDHYRFKFDHVAGVDNIADAASRICTKRDDPQFGAGKEPQELCSVTADPGAINNHLLAMTTSEVKEKILEDRELQSVIEWLEKDEKWPATILKYQAFQRDLYLQGGLLMKREKIVLPVALKSRAIRVAHLGHPGMSTMKNFLRQGLWWLGMDREIEEFVRSCPECQLVTKTNNTLPITLTELPTNPWEYVSMDFASASEINNWKALVLTDNYSRFLVALPMEKTDTEAVKNALKKVFYTYYIPKTLKADNGPPFNSMELKTWLQNVWGVKLIHSTPLNPTENGLVERSMQGINKISAIAKLGRKNWKEALAEYVAAYNTWPHQVTKVPPAELMFGRVVRGLLPDVRADRRQLMDEELRDRDKTSKFVRNSREDIRRKASGVEIAVGDMVLVAQAKRDKTDTHYKNALLKVVAIAGAGRVTVTNPATGKTFERNVKCLKKFVRRQSSEREEAGESEKKQLLDDESIGVALPDAEDGSKSEDEQPLSKRRNVREIKRPSRFMD